MEKRGRKKKYTRIHKDQILALYFDQKLPVETILALMEISYSTFRRALDYHNIPVRPKNYPWNEEACRKHSVLLRRIHTKARYMRMKNGSEQQPY